MRHAVNLTLGTLGMIYFFGIHVGHVVLMSSISWLMLALLPRSMSYKAVYAYTFIYLSCSHIYTYLYHYDSYDLEITTQTMCLTLRL